MHFFAEVLANAKRSTLHNVFEPILQHKRFFCASVPTKITHRKQKAEHCVFVATFFLKTRGIFALPRGCFIFKNMFKRLIFNILVLLFFGATFFSCIGTDTAYTKVAPGIWRGVLELEPYRVPVRDKDTVMILYDKFKPGELPFNFEVTYTDADHFYVDILNGAERIRVDSIQYGRDRSLARDTMNLWFAEYGNYLHCEIRGGVIQGYWAVPTKENYRIPFYAHAGRDYRFTNLQQPPQRDLSGNWAARFGTDQAEPYKAIGEFEQQGNRLRGTFRTETGDFRYLEGTVQDRKFFLSCFDGSHAFLFSGSIRRDSLFGEFRSGKHHRELFEAWKDDSFQLGAADTLTRTKTGQKLNFQVVSPSGKNLQYPGPDFAGKVKIFTIMGTWCPNCKDEQQFLTEYLKKNPSLAEKMAVVGFSFERHKDVEQANAHLTAYKKKMGIPFEIVYGGKADKAEAAKMFPALNHVLAFPTMMVVDQNDQVRWVHTGFDGPATSKYAAFQAEFDQLLKTLLP
jgi:thiol-disulfide isomerase/thioredoxin